MELRIPTSSPLGGSFIDAEQDFRYGAKILTSLHPPAFSTPQSSSDFSEHCVSEWMNCCDTIDDYQHDIEAFSDVILPDTEFDPKNFFNDLPEAEDNFEIYSPIRTSVEPIFDVEFQQYDFPSTTAVAQNPLTTSKLTIKLKRVKCPKINKHNQSKLMKLQSIPGKSCDLEISQVISPLEQSLFSPQELSIPLYCNLDTSYTLSTDIPLSPSVSPIPCENVPYSKDESFNEILSLENGSCITLKDVIDMDEADILLENYLLENLEDSLSENGSSGINVHSHDYNSDASGWDELHSPLSISSSMLASPSSLDNIPLSPLNTEDRFSSAFLDLKTNDRQRKKSDQRSKKTCKQKLSQESRYLRKKEQNKDAAVRYRMKKKLEDQNLMSSIKEEEVRQEELKKSYSSLKQEISFMKKLMRETFVAKNLVSPNVFKK